MDENLFSWFGHFYWLKGVEKMARIISIVNQKGGTGKSACTANLAVGLAQKNIEDGESVMTAEYRPVEYGKDYDVVNNPDKFQLYIDGKEAEE